jgi:hypothetical protein
MKNAFEKLMKLTRATRTTGHSLTELPEVLDEATQRHTTFNSFVEMLDDGCTMNFPKKENIFDRAEIDLLAIAYDMAMEAGGDDRRTTRN